ncbi:hypothetical protein V6N11_051561 [Hibiscus sabdariffa]|uniref:Uncharacterized protein n=1 Tax=Hibiscus sabdariffa TaxID=183260 RepID=A0ABR2U858_9ROSI
MDGFYIKVFMENNIGMSSSMPKATGNFSKMSKSNASKFPARVKEGLSYKDALLKKGGVEKSGIIETASLGQDLKVFDHHIGVMSNKEVEKFSFDIPPKVYDRLSNCLVAISVKGVMFRVRVSTMEFEDDRCWIDQDQVKSQHGRSVECLDINDRGNVPNKMVGISIPNSSEPTSKVDKVVPNSPSGHAAQSTSMTDYVEVSGLRKDDPKALPMPSINSPLHIGSTNSENLMEVPICEQLESNLSSENCLSIELVFNAVTGLYSIKTKYLKNAWPFSSPSLKFQLPGSTMGGAPNLEAKSTSANISSRSK